MKEREKKTNNCKRKGGREIELTRYQVRIKRTGESFRGAVSVASITRARGLKGS